MNSSGWMTMMIKVMYVLQTANFANCAPNIFVARNIFCCQKMCTYISQEGQNGHLGDK